MITPRLAALVPVHLGGVAIILLDNGLVAYAFPGSFVVSLVILPWASPADVRRSP